MSRPIGDTSPERGKGKVQLSTSVPEEIRQELVDVVRQRNITISEAVSTALRRYIADARRRR